MLIYTPLYISFSFLRKLYTAFCSSGTNLHSYQQCMRVPPHLSQYLLFVFLMIAILFGVKLNLNVILIYISFIANNIKHFFLYFLAIYTSLRTMFNLFAHFVKWVIYSFGVFFFLVPYIFCILILYSLNNW
jgi:hypothetical protein